MKTKMKQNLWKLWLMFGLLFTLSACYNSEDILDQPTVVSPGNEAVVRIKINTPAPSLPRHARMLIDPEHLITQVKVLIFEKESDTYRFQYMVDGRNVQTTEDNITDFDVRLLTSEKDLTLLLLANYGDAFDNYKPVAGSSLADLKEAVIASFDPAMTDFMPMFAEIERTGGILSATVDLSATMLRSIARIDVSKELEEDSDPFILSDMYVFRARNQIQIAPDMEHLAGNSLVVEEASVPVTSSFRTDYYMKESEEWDPERIEQLYVPEANAVEPANYIDATCVVIGGYYNGDENLETPRKTYYRIDFNSGVEGHSFGQVLRNHKYLFKVRKVMLRGYGTPEEAAANKSMNISVDVLAWNDFTTDLWFEGDHYIGVSSRTIRMNYMANDLHKLYIQSSLPFQMEWLDGSGVASSVGDVISNNDFNAEIVPSGNDAPEDMSVVHITTRQENWGGELESGLMIRAGRWEILITVIQQGGVNAGDRIIHVFSIEEVGDLGHNANVSSASGQAMRAILSNPDNFSPSGTVPIGGFGFMKVAPSYTAGTEGTSYLYNFKRFLDAGPDVLFLNNNNQLSYDAAVAVMDWLHASKNRVLIIGVDSRSTSQPLVVPDNGLLDVGTWNYYGTWNIGGAFMRAPVTDENRIIMEGPFGVVEESTYSKADNIAGFNENTNGSLIPLIVSSSANYSHCVIMGISTTERIVYIGDSQLNQTSRMSNNQGQVSSSLDVLQANLWAWIVSQVLLGES